MHALMPAIVLRVARRDAFDADAQTQLPDGKFGEIEEAIR